MYSEKVMDHFNNPRNVGEIENPSGVGTVGNAKCGDIMRMYLDIDDNGIIQEAKFKTFGCGAAVATSSMATELVKGKTIQEALQVTNKAVITIFKFCSGIAYTTHTSRSACQLNCNFSSIIAFTCSISGANALNPDRFIKRVIRTGTFIGNISRVIAAAGCFP